MADPTVLAEAYRRNLLPPEKAQAYEEGVRRGLVPADASIKALISQRASDPKSTMTVGGLVRRDVTGQPQKRGVLSDMYHSAMGGLSDLSGQVSDFATSVGAGGLPALPSLPGPLSEAFNKSIQPFSASNAYKTVNALATYAALGGKGAKEQLAREQQIAQYRPQTFAGHVVKNAVVMAPNAAFGPGGLIRRGAQVAVPALTSELARAGTEAAGGNDTAQAVASTVGAAAGGVLSGLNVRRRPIEAATQDESALAQFAKKTKQSPAEMEAQMQRYKAAGIEPTLADIVDEGGSGVLRDAASRQTPARQVATDFAEKRVLNLPSRIGRQAQAIVPENVPEAAPDLASRLGEVRTQIGEGDPGQQIHDVLNQRFTAANSQVDEAYKAARATSAAQAMIPRDQLPKVTANLREAVADFDPQNVPRVTRELDRLDTLSTPTARDLFDARSRLTNLRVSSDLVEAKAAKQATRALDMEIDRIDPYLTGDPKVVGTWRDAIAKRREVGQQFEGNDLINSLTEQKYRGGSMTNAVAPEDATNALLGKSPLGFVGKPNSIRDLTRLRDYVGPDSPAWKAMKGEVLDRLVTASTGPKGLDVNRLARNAERLGPHADLFFTPQEQQQFQQLIQSGQRPNPAAVGARIMDTNTEGVVGDAAQLSPDERAIAQSVAARTIQRDAGNTIGGAPGLARGLAEGSEQQVRNAAIFGDKAPQLEHGMRMEELAVRRARDISPRTGPGTANRLLDAAQNAQSGMKVVAKAGMHDWLGAAIDATTLWMRTFGMTDAQAERLIRIATDPRQTETAFKQLAALYGPTKARSIMKALKPARLAPAATAAYLASTSAAAQQPQP